MGKKHQKETIYDINNIIYHIDITYTYIYISSGERMEREKERTWGIHVPGKYATFNGEPATEPPRVPNHRIDSILEWMIMQNITIT